MYDINPYVHFLTNKNIVCNELDTSDASAKGRKKIEITFE